MDHHIWKKWLVCTFYPLVSRKDPLPYPPNSTSGFNGRKLRFLGGEIREKPKKGGGLEAGGSDRASEETEKQLLSLSLAIQTEPLQWHLTAHPTALCRSLALLIQHPLHLCCSSHGLPAS